MTLQTEFPRTVQENSKGSSAVGKQDVLNNALLFTPKALYFLSFNFLKWELFIIYRSPLSLLANGWDGKVCEDIAGGSEATVVVSARASTVYGVRSTGAWKPGP